MTIRLAARPSLTVPDTTITAEVLQHAARLPHKPALVDAATGEQLTYAQLADAIRQLAAGLAATGVGPGTTWALMAPNSPAYAVVFHALATAGATVTTLNPTYGASEIAFQLRDAGATALVTSSGHLEVARAAAAEAGVTAIWLVDAGDAPSVFSLNHDGPLPSVSVDPADHVVVLPYSSGTTGFPKGVMLTHRNLVANVAQMRGHLSLEEDDVIYAALPFFHIYGMQVLMNFGLAQGATVITVPRFDLVQMLTLVQAHRISQLFLVPPVVLALAKHPIVEAYDLSSVRQIFSGAAPLGGELAEAVEARLRCAVRQGYGMTEASPVTHAARVDDGRTGSVGTLVAGTELRLVDPHTGEDAAPGSPGEVWVRGPQVMKGYLNNPEATAQTVDANGWLHTGDIALVDADGHTFIVDRLKELIKVKGFQVAPAELEALLVTHAQIADAAVIGIPDDEAGERPKAFVVPVPGADLSAAEVCAFVAEHAAPYKRLAEVVFVPQIPKSASGKILRRELRGA